MVLGLSCSDQRVFARVCRQIDGPDVAIFGSEVGQRLVAADGESGDVGHRATQRDLGDLLAGLDVEEKGVGARSDQQFVAVDQQAASGDARGKLHFFCPDAASMANVLPASSQI